LVRERRGRGGRGSTLRRDIIAHAVDRRLANKRVNAGIEVERDQFTRGFRSGHHAAD
jgi:hypothetical protein